jgi:mannitol/fructose-specific phosphotransferase system IIA component (Ntr-type)
MKLATLLNTDHILLDLVAGEHWPVIVELVDQLVVTGSLPADQRDEVLEALRTREEQVSTGIGYGVAIPHTFSEKLDRVIAVFGRSNQGVDFQAVDGSPVHLVILFIVPKKDYHLHLQTLAAIAKMFTNVEVRRRLREAERRDEILEILAGKSSRSAAREAV